MDQQLNELTQESKRLICDSLSKVAEIVSASHAASPREIPLFFPKGIELISLKVNATGIGELTFTISGDPNSKPVATQTLSIERKLEGLVKDTDD